MVRTDDPQKVKYPCGHEIRDILAGPLSQLDYYRASGGRSCGNLPSMPRRVYLTGRGPARDSLTTTNDTPGNRWSTIIVLEFHSSDQMGRAFLRKRGLVLFERSLRKKGWGKNGWHIEEDLLVRARKVTSDTKRLGDTRIRSGRINKFAANHGWGLRSERGDFSCKSPSAARPDKGSIKRTAFLPFFIHLLSHLVPLTLLCSTFPTPCHLLFSFFVLYTFFSSSSSPSSLFLLPCLFSH